MSSRLILYFSAELRADSHMKIIHMVPQPVMNHAVNDLPVVHAVPCPCFVQHVRTEIHVFLPAGHDHVCISAPDGLGGQHDRLQTGTADLVHGNGANLPGQSRLDHGLSAGVLTEAWGRTHPMMTSSTSSALIPALLIASFITSDPRSVAGTVLRDPAKSPAAVLHAPVITTSLMNFPFQ